MKKAVLMLLLALPLTCFADDYTTDSTPANNGAIDTQTGQYYPPAGNNGVIDTQTGTYYQGAAGAFQLI